MMNVFLNQFKNLFKNNQAWLKLGLVFVFLGLISACQSNPTSSHYLASGESGFGGTGQKLASLSGFGGTGKSSSGFGGTGIVGTITGFGSIWVSGIEIGYGQNTQITSNLVGGNQLKQGQQVVLETLPLKDKTLTQKIHVFYPIAGKITSVKSGMIEINHQYRVNISQKTYRDTGLNLEKGQYIAVNGYQNTVRVWTATRLNQNLEQQSFYQPVPKLNFSEQVHRVVIEAGLQQFKHWSFGYEVMREVHQAGRIVIEAHELKGESEEWENHLHPSEIKPYDSFLEQRQMKEMRETKALQEAHQTQQESMDEMQEVQSQQHEMHDMQEMQSQQQDMREMQQTQSQNRDEQEMMEQQRY